MNATLTTTDAHDILAELIDETNGDAVEAYMEHLGLKVEDVENWANNFRDEYLGDMSPAEYAEQLTEDCGDLEELPSRLRYYIDFEKMGRDMELGGDISEVNGYLFRNN